MTPKIHALRDEISRLQAELLDAVQEQEAAVLYRWRGRTAEFEKSNIFRWLVTNRPQNLLTGPIIYSLIVPLGLLDLCVCLYQTCCFPIYRMAKVRRADYIAFDRHKLEYLNFIEKFHCTYCAYGNGVLAFASEVAARTEEYFCPIKHARKLLGSHLNYERFLSYGDAEDFPRKLEESRCRLAQSPPSDGH